MLLRCWKASSLRRVHYECCLVRKVSQKNTNGNYLRASQECWTDAPWGPSDTNLLEVAENFMALELQADAHMFISDQK